MPNLYTLSLKREATKFKASQDVMHHNNTIVELFCKNDYNLLGLLRVIEDKTNQQPKEQHTVTGAISGMISTMARSAKTMLSPGGAQPKKTRILAMYLVKQPELYLFNMNTENAAFTQYDHSEITSDHVIRIQELLRYIFLQNESVKGYTNNTSLDILFSEDSFMFVYHILNREKNLRYLGERFKQQGDLFLLTRFICSNIKDNYGYFISGLFRPLSEENLTKTVSDKDVLTLFKPTTNEITCPVDDNLLSIIHKQDDDTITKPNGKPTPGETIILNTLITLTWLLDQHIITPSNATSGYICIDGNTTDAQKGINKRLQTTIDKHTNTGDYSYKLFLDTATTNDSYDDMFFEILTSKLRFVNYLFYGLEPSHIKPSMLVKLTSGTHETVFTKEETDSVVFQVTVTLCNKYLLIKQPSNTCFKYKNKNELKMWMSKNPENINNDKQPTVVQLTFENNRWQRTRSENEEYIKV